MYGDDAHRVALPPTEPYFRGMWKYYRSLFREIPEFFRGTVEAWLFWIVGGLAVLATVFPAAARVRAMTLPTWSGPVALAIVVVYGLLRVNYDRHQTLVAKIHEYEAFPSRTYLLLCHFHEQIDHAFRMPMVSESDMDAFHATAAPLVRRFFVQVVPRLQRHEQLEFKQAYKLQLLADLSRKTVAQQELYRLVDLLEQFMRVYSTYAPRTEAGDSAISALSREGGA